MRALPAPRFHYSPVVESRGYPFPCTSVGVAALPLEASVEIEFHFGV
jgi:hypothetical protein